jgi:hypothetical protein
MQSLRSLLLALLLSSIPLIDAAGEACVDVKMGTLPIVFLPCIGQSAKEIGEYKAQNALLAKELAEYKAHTEQLEKEISELKGKISNALQQADVAKRVEEISNRLYGDVDSVYTIADEYALDAPIVKTTLTYIYADPTKHNIWAVIYPRGLIPLAGREDAALSFDFVVNKRVVYRHAARVDEDITNRFEYSLQGSGGGGREDENEGTNLAMAYPAFVHMVEIKPHLPREILPSMKGKTVNIQGYILVKRKLAGSLSQQPVGFGK